MIADKTIKYLLDHRANSVAYAYERGHQDHAIEMIERDIDHIIAGDCKRFIDFYTGEIRHTLMLLECKVSPKLARALRVAESKA
jgi:hypothetical protein